MKKYFAGATALIVALFFGAPDARAAVTLSSGDVVGGWQISFPTGIGLFSDGVTTDGQTLVLEKSANFTDSAFDGVVEGLQIIFAQVEEDATTFIKIADENVTNNTGLPWIAFQFSLADTGAAPGDVVFTESFNEISPFTNTDFSPTFIELNGGLLPNGATAFWGVGENGGQLVISAAPSENLGRLFSFKEQPIPIPLPAAAWMGLVGLAGVGALSRRAKSA